MTETFRCASCGGEFEKDWTDEEARAEAERNFPGLRDEDAALVCEDCFQRLQEAARAVRPN